MSEFEKLLSTYKERLESCACAEIENVSAFSDVEIAELHAEELQARDALTAHVAALEDKVKYWHAYSDELSHLLRLAHQEAARQLSEAMEKRR